MRRVRRKRKRKNIKVFILIWAVVIVAGIFFTREYVSAKNYEGPVIMVKEENDLITYEDYNEWIVQDNDKVYIDLQFLREHFDIVGDYDEQNHITTLTNIDTIIQINDDGAVSINQSTSDKITPIKKMNQKLFIPIEELAKPLKIQYFIQEDGSIYLESLLNKKWLAKASEDGVNVKIQPIVWSYESDELKKDERVEILKKEEDWYLILSSKGKIGYVKEKDLKDEQQVQEFEKNHTPIWKPESGKINMTWEYVYRTTTSPEKIGDLKGLNVIAPTWMVVSDENGQIKDKMSTSYIDWAKAKGYQIWPTLTNGFDRERTHQILKNSHTRQKIIDNVKYMIKRNGLDGVNIDFEDVYLEDKDRFVIFVRELTQAFHEQNLVVSIDVTVKGGSETWSQFFDRRLLGQAVDYMMLMAYDEHWGSSPVSGSVASIPWVIRGIEGLLEEVEASKLVLGVPFYTRVWIETPQDGTEGVKVTSKALGMEAIDDILEEYQLEKKMDDQTGQNYVTYLKDGAIRKIWLEDEDSIKARIQLVYKYGLAGMAGWRRGFEKENIWDVMEKGLSQ